MDDLFSRTRLPARVIARNIDGLCGTDFRVEAHEIAQGLAGLRLDHARRILLRIVLAALQERGVDQIAPV